MKKTILLLIFAALLPVACGRQKTGSRAQPTTQTIAPATAPAADSTGVDAVTQTVDIDDSRSEADGMASASNTTAAKKAPAKKKGRK